MKRKILALFLIVLLLTMGVSASGTFELEQVFYPIYSNGELVPTDDLPTLSYKDRTYVPLRKLSEATGLSVNFDTNTDTIQIYNTPLDYAVIYASAIDTFYNTTLLKEQFEDFDSELTLCLDGIKSYKNVDSILKRSKHYIDTFIPSKIARMKSDIKFLKDCDFLLGQEPISNLENSIYHAEQALILANKTYDLIEGYARGRYTQNFCYDSLYGYNSDGIRYIMGDHAFEIDKEYYLYTSLFLDNLFAL